MINKCTQQMVFVNSGLRVWMKLMMFNCKVVRCNDKRADGMYIQKQSGLIRQSMSVNNYDNMSYDSAFNLFLGHTRSTGRSNLHQGTIHNADQNLSFQEKSLLSALGPQANCSGDGMNYIHTNTINNTQMLCNDCTFGHLEPRDHVIQHESGNIDTYYNINGVTCKHVMVDFTNWQCVQQHTGVFIDICFH